MVNSDGQPIGIIERDALVTLIEKKAWYSRNQGNQIESNDIRSASHEELSEELLKDPVANSIT